MRIQTVGMGSEDGMVGIAGIWRRMMVNYGGLSGGWCWSEMSCAKPRE